MAYPSTTTSTAISDPQHHNQSTHNATSTSTSTPATPEKQSQYTSILPSERPSHETHRLRLHHTASHASHHDIPSVPADNNDDHSGPADDDGFYDKFSAPRKRVLTFVMAFSGFLAPISSTTVLSAVPEVAETYGCDGAIVNLSNAMYMLFMGVSPCFYGPIGNIYGRRWPAIISAALFTAFSVGTALAPNLASFFVFRILTAFQGTAFLVLGSTVIGDIYRPTERGTALGWFLSGTLIGPALGPFVGGIIVTFQSWRVIFWWQTGLAGLATLLVIFCLPETIRYKRSQELKAMPRQKRARTMWDWLNPFRVILLYRYPNLLVVALASSALVWNMYGLLTPIRYVLNPRFNLSTPLQSGLFYIAPGCGYLLGTFFGGRYADHYVKKYIRLRNGERISEDRLRSCLLFMGGAIPACMLVYGWTVEKRVGGVAVPVIMMFLQGVAQLFCFPSLNTYCLDVMPGRSSEVMAGNYMLRYLFAALGTAVCLPAIRKVGVGWFSTISALFVIVAALGVYADTLWGRGWRDAVGEKIAKEEEEKENRKAQSESKA